MLHIVSGPPCVGKSHFVRENASADDMVVDLDRIALAISPEGTKHHEYPPHIRAAAMRMRKMAVQAALGWARYGDAWVIHAKPSDADVRGYQMHGATFHPLTEDIEVLLKRAEAERPAWVSSRILNWQTHVPDAWEY